MSHRGTVASEKRKRESRWSPIVEPPRVWVEQTASLGEDMINTLDVDWFTFVEPPPEVEKVARWVALNGVGLENNMMRYIVDQNRLDGKYNFLRSTDPNHACYLLKLQEYRYHQYLDGNLRDDDDDASLDFVGDDAQANPSLQPPPLSGPLPPLREFICYSFPLGITPKELCIIKLTAQFLARYGLYFWRALMMTVIENPQFHFMNPAHSRFTFYTDLVAAYSRVLSTSTSAFDGTALEPFFRRLQLEKLDEGSETAMVDLNAFVGGVDCFTDMEYAHHSLVMEPPPHLSVIINRLPQMPPDQNPDEAVDTIQPDLEDPELTFPARITLKELGIMKLTAQFVARYGKYFLRALMVRVVMIPQFEFMEKTHSRNFFFNVLVDAYSHVLRPSKILKNDDACTATVLEIFFHRLQLEKLEDGVKTAMIDLYAFVGGLDFFAHRANRHFSVTLPPPEPISTMMKWLTQPDTLLQHTLGSLLSEYRFKAHAIEDDPPHRSGAVFFKILPQRSLSFTVPANITLKELGVIKLTAQFVTRYGSDFLGDLMKMPQFEFMNSESSIYGGLVDAYVGVLKPHKKPNKAYVLEVFIRRLQLEKLEEGAETAMIDLNAFMGGVDYFAHMDDIHYSAVMPQPQSLSTMVNRATHMRPDMRVQPPFGSQHSEYRAQDEQPPLRPHGLFPTAPCGWITLEELGVIKMTAMFAARYGTHFCRELIKRVVTKSQFKFMSPADSKFSFYKVFLDAYSRVLKPSNDACTATCLEGFFRCLQLEKLEEGVETAMFDLHAFVSGVDCFAQMKGVYYSSQMENVDYSIMMPKHEGVSMTMNREKQKHSGLLFRLPLGSQFVRLQVDPSPYPHPYDQFASLSLGMLIGVIRLPLPAETDTKRQKFDLTCN